MPSLSRLSDDQTAIAWRYWNGAGFYPRHRDAAAMGLDWPRPDIVARACERLRNCGMVVLLGKRGTGKTQLAACLSRTWIAGYVASLEDDPHRYDRDGPVKYMRLYDYFADIKRSFDGERDPRKHARTCGLLVVDECQERYETAFEDIELTALIDHRYGHERPTILIANLTPEELAKGLGTSVSSRLQESGLIVVCDWPSFRARANA